MQNRGAKANKKMTKNAKNSLDALAEFCNTVDMSVIRDTMLKRMDELGVTTYRLSKMVEGKVPQRTVYAFIKGEFDASTEVASALMDALGLTISVKKNLKRNKRTGKVGR